MTKIIIDVPAIPDVEVGKEALRDDVTSIENRLTTLDPLSASDMVVRVMKGNIVFFPIIRS